MDVGAHSNLNNPAYLVLSPLVLAVEREVKKLLGTSRLVKVLDIGCGKQPYKFIFNGHPNCYVGLDLQGAGYCDVIARGEQLPFCDSAFDLILSFQVLEHVENPLQMLKEIYRVLAAGGYCFLSTHGNFFFHPSPNDYWRWTHQGLETLFQGVGLDIIKIIPQGGTGSCLCYLLASYISFLSYKLKWLTPVRWISVPLLNKLGPRLDLFFPFINHPYSFNLTANYLIYSSKPDPNRK